MRRRTLRSSLTKAFRALGVTAAVVAGSSCHEPLDTERIAPPKATLGDDIFGIFCDRVGASSFNEDHVGQSYQGICHYDDEGQYANTVDTSVLPPPAGEAAAEARRLGVAKLETMARWRGDIVRAINAALPDVEIDDITRPGSKVRLRDALLALTQSMSALYEENPFDPGAAPPLPESTRAIGRLVDALAGDDEAVGALSKIWGRQGYRPAELGLGAVRAALAYPDLRPLTRSSLDVLGPGGTAAPLLQQAFAVGKQELRALKPTIAESAPLVVDAALAQPNRPRTTIELATALVLDQDPLYAESDTTVSSYIARRDRRGFVLTSGVIEPFADVDGDGLADVDAFGRFSDSSGALLSVDPPFAIPGVTQNLPDAFWRLSPELYQYIDTSRTPASAVLRMVKPLLDPTKYAGDDDPEPWKSEHEALMYTLAGSYLLFGDREDATYDYETETIRPAGESCPSCVPYRRFRGEDSPLADLAHAAGQVLADRDSDALLLGVMDLLENHEDVLARLVSVALKARDLADEHDRLAAEGKEPLAQIPYETPIWDEMAGTAAKIVDRTGLLPRILQGLASDEALTPRGGSRNMGDAIAAMMRNRDQLTYNPDEVNGPAINLTVGVRSLDDPRTPVDLTKPKTGDNRSCLERSLQLIHDTAGAVQCNKPDAVLRIIGIPLSRFGECELFQIDDLAAFYLDALLPDDHPKRTQLPIKSDFLRGTLDAIPSILPSLSGLTGLVRSRPTPAALGRLIFFGADSQTFPNMRDLDPYRDTQNETINTFITDMLEPGGTNLCPRNAAGANVCSSRDDLMRIRLPNTLFLMERLGFGDYLRPLITAFAEVAPDYTGEKLFIELLTTAYRHWPGPDHGPECNGEGTPEINPRYCSGAGANTYEPLIADVVQLDDAIASTVALTRTIVQDSRVTVQRGPRSGQVLTGAEVVEKLGKILFSQSYAASVNMTDRRGNKSARWVNGKTQEQLTVFNLGADALHGIDLRFDQSSAPDAQARKSQWERGQRELIDTLLAVEGEGEQARFKNRALPRLGLGVLRVLREQLNARCPDRETTGQCPWAREELGKKVADTLSGPLFAALVDVQEAIRADETARRELEKFLTYMIEATADDASFQALLASLADGVQILADDGIFTPILKAGAVALNPAADPEGPGAADRGLQALKALNEDRYDVYHALDHVLPALVTPMEDGRAPIQIFLDAIADVNRLDASSTEPLRPLDYRQMFVTARDFMTDETRGLEQIYAIIQKRPRD